MSGLTYPEAIVVGALQGVTELFPVSSLGHSILLPALVGGRWQQDLDVSAPESPYLAFLVGLHVATALALLVHYRRDWVRIILGFSSSLRYRRIEGPDQRLAWLIVLATIPVGVSGLLLEHLFRTTLGRPFPAAVFLVLNGLVLLTGERLRRRSPPAAAPEARSGVRRRPPEGPASTVLVDQARTDQGLAVLPAHDAMLIGAAQSLALLPGVSRSGITMVAGLARGLSHEEAARFSFLLATPVILAAGVLKIPDLFGSLGEGIGGQVLAGSAAAFVAAYAAVRWLERYFRSRTLTPFAVYSIVAGLLSVLVLTVRA